jgi:hypothetical protein
MANYEETKTQYWHNIRGLHFDHGCGMIQLQRNVAIHPLVVETPLSGVFEARGILRSGRKYENSDND